MITKGKVKLEVTWYTGNAHSIILHRQENIPAKRQRGNRLGRTETPKMERHGEGFETLQVELTLHVVVLEGLADLQGRYSQQYV